MKRPTWILVLTVAVSGTLLVAGYAASGSAPAGPPRELVGTPGEPVPLLFDVTHIPTRFSSHEPYNSVPPTSGPHVAQTVAPGVYREEIPEEVQVHALEHGHVLVQYAPGLPAELVRELEAIARRYSRDVIVAPYSKLEDGIALTAWGRIQRLDQVEPEAIETFVKAMRGRYNHGWKQ